MADRRIDGIEWLRAIMSVFVVAWHLGGGGKSLIWGADWKQHTFTLSDLFSFHILLLAVPSFMLVSNYLLAMANPSLSTTLRRSQRVGALLLFWPVMFMLFMSGWQGISANFPTTWKDGLYYVLTGGWTVYYFFVAVLITYGLTFVASRLPTWLNVALLLLSTALMGLAPLASAKYDWQYLSAYWSPINFVPYAFAAVVILRWLDRDAPAVRAFTTAAALVLAGAGLAVLEWRLYPDASLFSGQGFAFAAYTRPSLVATTMALMILAIRWNIGVPAVIGFMAKYSLALYCLHLIAAEPLRLVVKALGPDLPPLGQAWLLILLVIPTSYLAAKVLSLVWKERLLF